MNYNNSDTIEYKRRVFQIQNSLETFRSSHQIKSG